MISDSGSNDLHYLHLHWELSFSWVTLAVTGVAKDASFPFIYEN